MALTYDEAYLAITSHFQSKWDAGTTAIVGMVPEVRYAGIEKPDVPVKTFARFVMEPVTNPRSTLRNAEYGQRFENNGIIIVQLLVRRVDETAAKQVRKLGMFAQNIFRDPAFPGCFIFRNIRINNLEPEPSFLRANVVTEYQFDELV